MYNAFRARISQDSSVDDAIAAEKRQVEFDMESVTFCKVVLDESASTQSTPRTWDDLARVRKYIQMVVVPYMAKMAPPVVAPSDPAPASDIQTNVHVAWAGRRHNSSRGGRPAIDRSVGGVPASYMNHASAAPSAASSPVATSSQVSIQSEDVEASSGGENNANAVEYWRQHAALKAAHYETCKVVYHAFQHFLVTSSADQDASQRQKLTYLLGFVEFCCHVLSESSATHPARPISDLKRVVKSVNKIMLPYRHKIGMAEKAAHATAHGSLQVDGGAIHEAPTMMMAAATKSPMSIASTSSTASRTTVLPSVQNLLQRSSTRDNAPGTTYAQLDRRSDPAADQYWHHKSQLEATYLRQVMAAQTFFDAYRHKFATQRSQHLQDVVHLCDYADYCRQVLSEDRQAASQRSLQELHVVHSYITALVLPHLASLQALVDRDNSTAPAIPPTDDCHRMSRLHQHTDSFLQAMDQPKPAVDKEGSRGSSGAVVGMSDPASTYWRKVRFSFPLAFASCALGWAWIRCVMTAYVPPEWAANGSNRHGLSVEVIKGGIIVEKLALDTSVKPFLVAGHLFVVDLGSTHGTFVNKRRIPATDPVELHVGDVVVFGESTRIYTILGPHDLMPEEYSSDNLAKLRAKKKKEAEEADHGATWGFREDAVEESDSSDDEAAPATSKPNVVPLPDYLRHRKADVSGPYVSNVTKDSVNLTKDAKLYTRLQNRIQKLENVKLESQRIRAKQNVGLTEGQEAALARNETRIQELHDEIETLEAQLLAKHTQRTAQKDVAGASTTRWLDPWSTRSPRIVVPHGMALAKMTAAKANAPVYASDDDDFFDRTKANRAPAKHKAHGGQVLTYVSIAATLAGLRADLKLLEAKLPASTNTPSASTDDREDVDSLDKYMMASARSLVEEDVAKAEAGRTELRQRIREMESLLEVATPAWAKLVAPAARDNASNSTFLYVCTIIARHADARRVQTLAALLLCLTPNAVEPLMATNSPDQHVMTEPSDDAPQPFESALDVSSRPLTTDDVAGGSAKHGRDDPEATEAPRPKRVRLRRKDVATKPPAGTTSVFDSTILEGGDVVWQPPTNQTGDGRTALNDKYGY
ncbi:hypothetical protein DYB32_007835 [Aphanomyces invadans]|uniref:FHA domain-containing protein n=1 Tax=Aphanomyces invadans TaxID=157072 RepID=A0A3R6YZZ8_9STRA|nr:hypothetical protein DYB32_007835 [Aphanomyces invadans]